MSVLNLEMRIDDYMKVGTLNDDIFSFLMDNHISYYDSTEYVYPWRTFTVTSETHLMLVLLYPDYEKIVIEHV